MTAIPNPTTAPSPQQAVADSVLDELARQWANGTPIVLRYDGEGRPIDGWEFSMPRFRSAVRSALATLAPQAVSEPTADAAVNEGDCSPEERRRFEARISLASGGNADFDREEEWPQSYKNRRTEDMLFGWLAARRDCAVMQVSTVSELPAGVAGDEAVERAAFVAEAKRRGWTPGEFMLGAYAGWLASTLATPTHQAAEPLKPWRDAVEVLLRRPELADRARIEALLAGSLHQAAEPAASDKEAGIEYTLKNPAGVWSSYLVEKREHTRCEAELRNCESRIREQRSEIKRLAASSEPAQPAASDMVLVPRKPTREMLQAMRSKNLKTAMWSAALAAAPSAAHEVKR